VAGPTAAVIVAAELRDYQRINAEAARLLNGGVQRIRIEGVEGQRLLLWGLRGDWSAVIELRGAAGPELAAELDAAGLTVVCRGPVADGAGRSLQDGRLLLLDSAGVALGYDQAGGLIVAAGPVGARPGLAQRGGDLVLLGRVGRLAGERQRGGRIGYCAELAGADAGFGATGGRVCRLPPRLDPPGLVGLDPEDRAMVERALNLVNQFQTVNPDVAEPT
jgi:glutamate synthase domain-containing protein 3